ncbi:MAG: hypothetical protein ACK49I_03755, partial [Verrucomicrobiota bacterium]
TQWATFALAQQSDHFFWCVSFLLHDFGFVLIQILSLSLDQFFRRRPPWQRMHCSPWGQAVILVPEQDRST